MSPATESLPLHVRARLALAAKCGKLVSEHRAAWARVESEISDSAKRGDKVFEVHHRIEKARERYFQALVDGEDVAGCFAAARNNQSAA